MNDHPSGHPADYGALERRISEADDVIPQTPRPDVDDLSKRSHSEFVIQRPYEQTSTPAFFGIPDDTFQRSPLNGELDGAKQAVDQLTQGVDGVERINNRQKVAERALIQMQEVLRKYPGAVSIGRELGQVVLFRNPVETPGSDTYGTTVSYIMLTAEGWMAINFPRPLDPEMSMRDGNYISEVDHNEKEERKLQQAIARAAENPMDHPLEGWKILPNGQRKLSIAGYSTTLSLDGVHISLASASDLRTAVKQEIMRYELQTFERDNDIIALEVLAEAEQII